MGKGQGSVTNISKRPIPWEEVKRHTAYNDRWIVIKDQIYDISNFQKSHPGGGKIIGHFAGQDVTVSDYSSFNVHNMCFLVYICHALIFK